MHIHWHGGAQSSTESASCARRGVRDGGESFMYGPSSSGDEEQVLASCHVHKTDVVCQRKGAESRRHSRQARSRWSSGALMHGVGFVFFSLVFVDAGDFLQ